MSKRQRTQKESGFCEEWQNSRRSKVEAAPKNAAATTDLLLSPAAKASISTIAPHPSPATERSGLTYETPSGSYYISSSLKVDDPATPMRIGHLGHLFTLLTKRDPITGKEIWFGITWAEIFFPVVGEKPKSVVGSQAYEVILKQSTKDGGQIVRENVVTTGRVIGVVMADLPDEMVSLKIDNWFLKSEVFKKGRRIQVEAKLQTVQAGSGGRPGSAIAHTAVRGGENRESSVKASCAGCAGCAKT